MWFVSEKKYKRLLERKDNLLRSYSILNQENEKLTEWISSILKAFGEQRLGNCTFPIVIPYFKHNKAIKDMSCDWLFLEEEKADYNPTEEIIIPELHIIRRGL